MFRTLMLLATLGTTLPAGALVVSLDGRILGEVDALIYHPGSRVFEVRVAAGQACSGTLLQASAGQLGLMIDGLEHAMSLPIRLTAGPGESWLQIDTVAGDLRCAVDGIFKDRLQLGG
ncbi:hypothetical protein [Wenzhouxiangella marina]|uniref:Uncharacterized protein n=1 Tax=Wenzhouxiangella marina TaxID=1579979 RepID=A0A0K0XXB6_9GAMM|nr:hypothetical protein [Wenzhouxiangella marina]AKS42339.1 hypothetical protein WM2015_1973 [Wenzhouxiangella marina]MBB6085888.1 hypothetical protein [Wenzhouxiangella marina]